MTREDIIKMLTDDVAYLEEQGDNMNATSWNYEEGILISGNQAKLIIELLTNMSYPETA